MRVRINPNYGAKRLKVRANVNPVARMNNRANVAMRGSTNRNKAKVNNPRINSNFRRAVAANTNMANRAGGTAGAGMSRALYLAQTASRYPRASQLAA